MKSREELESQFKERIAAATAGGDPARLKKQKEAGKLTARERIAILMDEGSFEEFGALVQPRYASSPSAYPSDAVVTGVGNVNRRPVAVYAQDFTVAGGTLGEAHARKICSLMDKAMRHGFPIVGLNDSGGGRIQEGVRALGGYGEIFLRTTLASGVVPQLSAIMGPCAGGAVYCPSITDFVFMVEQGSYMFITGPEVIRAVTREEVTKDSLGGYEVHATKTGVCHVGAPSDRLVIAKLRKLLSYLPSNNRENPPRRAVTDPVSRPLDELEAILPNRPSASYDVKRVISLLFDRGSFFEIHELFATNIVVGFATIGGQVVGVVANQPAVLAGCLDVDASRKAARFVRFCDCFNIPLVTLVDVPGFLPGIEQEYGGIITHGAKLLYAFAEATTPKITIILRKAYGGAYDTMASKHVRADVNFSLPSGEIAVVGSEAAVDIIHARRLKESSDPQSERARLVAEYHESFANPYDAASMGFVDEVIHPRVLRERVADALAMLSDKVDRNPPKKHGNIPL